MNCSARGGVGGVVEEARNPKIGELDTQRLRQQEILRLGIAVCDERRPSSVQILDRERHFEAFSSFRASAGTKRRRRQVFSNESLERAPINKLYHDARLHAAAVCCQDR